MEKANELLKLVEKDSSLDTVTSSVVYDQISISRNNKYCRQLSLLARNSKSAVKSIISAINDFADKKSNDFRVFSLLIVLSDAEVSDAIDLSRTFATRDDLSKSKLIAINILLRESMYGRNI